MANDSAAGLYAGDGGLRVLPRRLIITFIGKPHFGYACVNGSMPPYRCCAAFTAPV
ncbi:hypothetical protein FA13DRAFT_1725647, partial [Coprinellus micaceus]